MDDISSRDADGLTRKPRIRQIAGMATQEVIAHAAADTVELDALPD